MDTVKLTVNGQPLELEPHLEAIIRKIAQNQDLIEACGQGRLEAHWNGTRVALHITKIDPGSGT